MKSRTTSWNAIIVLNAARARWHIIALYWHNNTQILRTFGHETRCRTLLVQAQCYVLQRADDVMSHDQKRASDWLRQDPVAEQLVVRDFTRPSFSGGLKGVACETRETYSLRYIASV